MISVSKLNKLANFFSNVTDTSFTFLCTKEAKFSNLQLQNMQVFLHRTRIISLYNIFEQVPDRVTVHWYYLQREIEKDKADL